MEREKVVSIIVISLVIFALILLLGLAFGVFKDKKSEVKVRVVEQVWSGWTEKQPAGTEKTLTLSVGGIIKIDEDGFGDFKFRINKINNDGVEIESIGDKMAPGGNAGVDLYGWFTKENIKEGDVLELGTPTLDASLDIKIYVLDIIKK
jgi:hypothetical protein